MGHADLKITKAHTEPSPLHLYQEIQIQVQD